MEALLKTINTSYTVMLMNIYGERERVCGTAAVREALIDSTSLPE